MKFAHNRKSFLSFAFSCLFFFSLLSPICAADLENGFYPARVKDISDRAYEPAIIELLDNAKESIILSMYILKPQEKGPVNLLMNDLEEALERGVSVEIYLNTREDRGVADKNILKKHLAALTKKGAKIYEFTPRYRLHDKVIIVDSRYVVEGSVNWSISAIKSNYESAVLIDSPELAKAKLIRMRRFPLKDGDNDERPDRPKGLEPLPEGAYSKRIIGRLETMSRFGYIQDKFDTRDYLMRAYLPLAKLPKRVDHGPKASPVRDQGEEGTCVGFATAFCRTVI